MILFEINYQDGSIGCLSLKSKGNIERESGDKIWKGQICNAWND